MKRKFKPRKGRVRKAMRAHTPIIEGKPVHGPDKPSPPKYRPMGGMVPDLMDAFNNMFDFKFHDK